MPQHDDANARASERQPQSLRAMAEAMKKKSAEKASRPAPVSAPAPSAPVIAPPPVSAPHALPSAPHTLPSAVQAAPVAVPPPPPQSAAPASIAPVTSDVASMPPSAMAAAPAVAHKQNRRGLAVAGLVVGLAAVAAVGFVGSQMLNRDTQPTAARADMPASQDAEVDAKSSKGFVVAAQEEASSGVDLGALPDADEADEEPEAAPVVGGPLPSGELAVVEPESDEKEADGPTRGPKGDLGEGIHDAVGDVDTSTHEVKMDGATKLTHEIPQRPPQGAVAARVRPGRMAAKACVAGADAVTRVQLSFTSSGAVTSVSVGGWAAEHGQAGCVKAAFQGVNVGQFQDASYSFPVSVRP